jgi:hypothetical protein
MNFIHKFNAVPLLAVFITPVSMRIKVLFFLVFILSKSASVFATDYYVNNTGNDNAAGSTPALAWRTLTRINATKFQPGDRVLLAGGQSFSGGIWVRGNSQGTASQPIVFRSYGAGRATIQSGDSFGFYAHNTAGIELRQLNFVGSGRLTNQKSGVSFYLDSADTHLQHLRLDSLDVSGYQQSGISISSDNGLSGYSDVRITNSLMHANGEAGLTSYESWPIVGLAHHNWYVGSCTAYDNSGRADVTNSHTGNGIVLSGIDGVIIEKCLAYHNGWLNANPNGGPVGIWGWACNNLVIQQCESHHNLSGTSKDGGGFDLDGGCTNSVMQYNYSHDNQGPGFLLAQFDEAPAMHDLTIRYNISENDARGFSQGAIELWSSGTAGGIVNANIYNNTVYLSAPADGSAAKAVYVMSGGITGINVRNNVLQTAAGVPMLATVTTNGIRFEGNCYWTPGGALLINWNGTAYTTLDTWRAATSQETLGGGTRSTGLYADPQLTDQTTSNISAPATGRLASYNPSPSSALIGAGLSLATEFGINPGPLDFFGNPTPSAGQRGNIGASEVRAVLATTPSKTPNSASTTWGQVYPTIAHNELHVAADLGAERTIEVQLVDMLGHTCRTWLLANTQVQSGNPTLPLAGLAVGRYVAVLRSGSRLLHQSLVVAAE